MNQSTEINSLGNSMFRRWVLVAGTGIPKCKGLSDRLLKLVEGTDISKCITLAEEQAAKAIGKALANYQYGLVSGGWEGVDKLVTEAFVSQLQAKSLNPTDYLIQVVPEDTELLFNQGRLVRVPHGGREWLEPQKYADAVILIGGRGGTYVTWLGALHDGLPRFPLGATTGDAEKAFKETVDYWELMPVPGISRTQFEDLGKPIKSESDADWLANYLVEKLLTHSLKAVDDVERRNTETAKSMFISYSRKDSDWVNRLRTLLRPAERRGLLSTWIDEDIEEGKPWEIQIRNRLGTTNFGLLLLSKNLLESKYVKDIEIPAFIERVNSKESDFRLFWVLLEPCEWQSIEGIKDVQAIGSLETAITQCETDADKQCRLIDIVERIVQGLS